MAPLGPRLEPPRGWWVTRMLPGHPRIRRAGVGAPACPPSAIGQTYRPLQTVEGATCGLVRCNNKPLVTTNGAASRQ